MPRCEACGGDGLIEVGAYRGDESDTTTRECRLCGGVVTGTVGAELDRLAQNAGHEDFSTMMETKSATPSSAALARLGYSAEVAAKTLSALGQAGFTHRHFWDKVSEDENGLMFRCNICSATWKPEPVSTNDVMNSLIRST